MQFHAGGLSEQARRVPGGAAPLHQCSGVCAGDMFADEVTREQNQLNQNLFEDQQQMLQAEVPAWPPGSLYDMHTFMCFAYAAIFSCLLPLPNGSSQSSKMQHQVQTVHMHCSCQAAAGVLLHVASQHAASRISEACCLAYPRP